MSMLERCLYQRGVCIRETCVLIREMSILDTQMSNLVPRGCDPREGTRGSGIIRFREESAWPLIWNAHFGLSQDSWLPATDYPRASRSFPRIAGSGNEIVRCPS